MLNAISTQYLQEFTSAVASAASVSSDKKMFAITPVMETKLRDAIKTSHAFLGLIHTALVAQIKGQVIDVGLDGLATGRADGRFSVDVDQRGNTYELVKTDSGSHVKWEEMTQWANSGNKGEWLNLMKASIAKRFALDMLRIGFNGTHIATITDPKKYTKGQDVNKGWLTIVKEKVPAQVLASAKLDPTGKTPGSYKNLDSLAQDLINTTIAEEFRQDDDLVVIVGSSLVAAEQHRLLEAADKPTEHRAAQALAKTMAGKKAYVPPFFPSNGIWITNLKNLQILTQSGTQWRKQENNDDRLRYESNHIRMEGYAVGNMNKFAAIENVEIIDDSTSETE
ncbi:phage major capsid protein, P2 family [Vibrio quintilis]|uniref:Phage major capsid protein, P2 family n=1 Tax=Vibrio quintilis TaxID=1117707 RepID=A0A1M7YZ85_9VIBR|nr:phage major capsid protein, P2 family [Vibrio quintilis]SHO57883.1 Phage major capsid protein, P2 family [Vibrio quintilis]